MRYRLEYAPVWLLAGFFRVLPRALARALGIAAGLAVYFFYSRLRRVGIRNLNLAFPALPGRKKKRILRAMYINLGRQLAEFALFPRYTRNNVEKIAVYEGFQNFAEAQARGKGVVFLTA